MKRLLNKNPRNRRKRSISKGYIYLVQLTKNIGLNPQQETDTITRPVHTADTSGCPDVQHSHKHVSYYISFPEVKSNSCELSWHLAEMEDKNQEGELEGSENFTSCVPSNIVLQDNESKMPRTLQIG